MVTISTVFERRCVEMGVAAMHSWFMVRSAHRTARASTRKSPRLADQHQRALALIRGAAANEQDRKLLCRPKSTRIALKTVRSIASRANELVNRCYGLSDRLDPSFGGRRLFYASEREPNATVHLSEGSLCARGRLTPSPISDVFAPCGLIVPRPGRSRFLPQQERRRGFGHRWAATETMRPWSWTPAGRDYGC